MVDGVATGSANIAEVSPAQRIYESSFRGASVERTLKEIEVGTSTTTFNPDRDRERKGKLNMRKLKTLTDEYEFLSNKFKGSIPRCVRNRLSRLEDVINVKTAIYEEALKND